MEIEKIEPDGEEVDVYGEDAELLDRCPLCLMPICWADDIDYKDKLVGKFGTTRMCTLNKSAHVCKNGESYVYQTSKKKPNTHTHHIPIYTVIRLNKSFVIQCPRCDRVHPATEVCRTKIVETQNDFWRSIYE
jgi:hypothetical protein